MMRDSDVPRWELWARFRFSVIGALLSSPPSAGALQEQLRLLADKLYQHPLRPEPLRLGFSTIERWYYQAKDAPDPMAVLGRKLRADAGQHWALNPELMAVLEQQYGHYPRWSVQLHADNLAAVVAERPTLGPVPSYQTVRRRMLEKGWVRLMASPHPTEGQSRAARRRLKREIRSYEATHVHALWHLDFHQARLKIVDAAGHWHTPVALAILDDRSRLCCHLQFYLAESAENLVHGLMQALLKRGLPRALMSDNGAAMVAEETRQGLLRLGIEQKFTLPYSAYQNGKQEVFWAQLEGRLLEMIRSVEPRGLTFLNHAAQAWVEQDYHRKIHREIDASPLERMLAGPSVQRPTPDQDALNKAFCRQVARQQRTSDGTVTVEGVRYEVPSRFRHLRRLMLRYPGWNRSRLWLVDGQTGAHLAPLLPLDKQRNASGGRALRQPIEKEIPAPNNPSEMPLLLRRWLADYAATGLPPAYIPKEEMEETP